MFFISLDLSFFHSCAYLFETVWCKYARLPHLKNDFYFNNFVFLELWQQQISLSDSKQSLSFSLPKPFQQRVTVKLTNFFLSENWCYPSIFLLIFFLIKCTKIFQIKTIWAPNFGRVFEQWHDNLHIDSQINMQAANQH